MKIMEDLDKYLNTNKKTSLDDGSHEVCDLVTGECYIVKEKDGLIERHNNTKVSNRNVKVKTHGGLKELLND